MCQCFCLSFCFFSFQVLLSATINLWSSYKKPSFLIDFRENPISYLNFYTKFEVVLPVDLEASSFHGFWFVFPIYVSDSWQWLSLCKMVLQSSSLSLADMLWQPCVCLRLRNVTWGCLFFEFFFEFLLLGMFGSCDSKSNPFSVLEFGVCRWNFQGF